MLGLCAHHANHPMHPTEYLLKVNGVYVESKKRVWSRKGSLEFLQLAAICRKQRNNTVYGEPMPLAQGEIMSSSHVKVFEKERHAERCKER